MSNKKSNVISFKGEVNKRFNKEKEIKFTLDEQEYKLGKLVHQSGDMQSEDGMEFIFELDEDIGVDDDGETIH